MGKPLLGYDAEWETTYSSHWRALAAGQGIDSLPTRLLGSHWFDK